MQRDVLEQAAGAALPTYVVWVPMSRGMERDVPKATIEVPDARASHFWDGDKVLVKAYRETLKLPEDAWDVFLLYPQGVTWQGERPPAPAYWMHQLGSRWLPRVQGPYFDAGAFLQRTRELLARPVAGAQD